MGKIKYTCKACGWETSIWEEWQDLKPQRCMNRKCNTSFRVKPDMLNITAPDKKVAEVQQTKSENTESKKYGKKFNKD